MFDSNWTAAGVWIAALSLAGIAIRQIVPWLKVSNETDKALIDLLMARVQRLEEKIERQERRHSAEQRHVGHKYRNVAAAFDAMLSGLKVSPDRVPQIVAEIEAMRQRHMEAEAAEMKALYGDDFKPEPEMEALPHA